MNIDQLKQELCKQMALIEMIEKSQQKERGIACQAYWQIARETPERDTLVAKQNKVTDRLVSYLTRLTQRP